MYRSYLAKGYISPNPARIVYREAFGLPSTRTCIATDPQDRLLGTVSLVGESVLGFDVERTHRQEVEDLRSQGRGLAEVTCLAIRPPDAWPSVDVYFALTRFLVQLACCAGTQDLVLSVHPRHRRFYARHFAASALGPVRSHPSVNGHPAACCRIDLEKLKGRVDPRLWRRYFGEPVPESRFAHPPVRTEDHLWLTAAARFTAASSLAAAHSRGGGQALSGVSPRLEQATTYPHPFAVPSPAVSGNRDGSREDAA